MDKIFLLQNTIGDLNPSATKTEKEKSPQKNQTLLLANDWKKLGILF